MEGPSSVSSTAPPPPVPKHRPEGGGRFQAASLSFALLPPTAPSPGGSLSSPGSWAASPPRERQRAADSPPPPERRGGGDREAGREPGALPCWGAGWTRRRTAGGLRRRKGTQALAEPGSVGEGLLWVSSVLFRSLSGCDAPAAEESLQPVAAPRFTTLGKVTPGDFARLQATEENRVPILRLFTWEVVSPAALQVPAGLLYGERGSLLQGAFQRLDCAHWVAFFLGGPRRPISAGWFRLNTSP